MQIECTVQVSLGIKHMDRIQQEDAVMSDTSTTGQGLATAVDTRQEQPGSQDFVYTPKEPSTTRLKNKVEEWKREAFVSGTFK